MTGARNDELARLIEPTLDGLGYALVRVRFVGGAPATLQVMAERRDGQGMMVEDCESISRALSAKLDVEDPIPGAYALEVSSPGIDRPLVRPADFGRFLGHLARVEVKAGARRRYKGRIARADDRHFQLALGDGEEAEIAYADVTDAKLVLTDELIAAGRA